MRVTSSIVAIAVWLISASVGKNACDAGFVLEVDATRFQSESAGSVATPAQSRDTSTNDDAPSLELMLLVNPALGQGNSSTSPTGSPARVTGHSTTAALPEQSPPAAMPVAERLEILESPLIPRVDLSSVFRPPRV